jgi:hypothetical protein
MLHANTGRYRLFTRKPRPASPIKVPSIGEAAGLTDLANRRLDL